MRVLPLPGNAAAGWSADPVEVDQFQKLPYGTEVWHAAYGKARAVVEGLFGDLKKKKGCLGEPVRRSA